MKNVGFVVGTSSTPVLDIRPCFLKVQIANSSRLLLLFSALLIVVSHGSSTVTVSEFKVG